MKHLEGKLFRSDRGSAITQGPIYILVERVYQAHEGSWFFEAITNSGDYWSDRTVFLNYQTEVTDPAEIILFSPKNDKRPPSPTRGE